MAREREARNLPPLGQTSEPDYPLPPEMMAHVNAYGFAFAAESPYWRQAMLEAVDDYGLTEAQVGELFRKWNMTESCVRPSKSRFWFLRGRSGRVARDFIDRALGRDKPAGKLHVFAMDGGLAS